MAVPWLAALKAVPWSTLLSQAPTLIEHSRKLFTRASTPIATPTPDALSEIRARLDTLDSNTRTQAELLRQIAEQMQRLTLGLEVVAARTRLALWLALAALIGSGALWLWWFVR